MKNNNKLSSPTIWFHWLTGLAFLTVLGIGLSFDYIPKGPSKGELMGIHKSLGVIVFVIATLRIIWRFKEGPITSLSAQQTWQDKAAKGIHHLLLLSTVLMPISGIVMTIAGGRNLSVFGAEVISAGEKIPALASAFNTIHHYAAFTVLVIVLIHIAASIKHHVIDKDRVLSRMLGR
ncbi:cytochrome b [Vibrio rumoiensis]|uniref:Cytochrome B n=1 Tax=Vibrio rumoiensis 1S-45 TaxID=1188252 RepID=A0A1E5E2P4_9VIBR|nr:cytochrome b [Vibrio rumoiensis]OEF25487.1 cytochrome B [Vibrio rumoiensis 1S-45]